MSVDRSCEERGVGCMGCGDVERVLGCEFEEEELGGGEVAYVVWLRL